MLRADAPVLTDKQLRDAMEKADMPPRDYRIFGALIHRADWATGVIPARFQPRSVLVLAKVSRMSPTTVKDGLNHLEQHGWITRTQKGAGRGQTTTYGLLIGKDCDCAESTVERPGPKSDAERARAYRERRKAAGNHVTNERSSHGIHVTKQSPSRDEDAGRGPVFTERASRGEGVWGEYLGGAVVWKTGRPAHSIGDEVNEEGWSA